jgi:hypothetical protein
MGGALAEAAAGVTDGWEGEALVGIGGFGCEKGDSVRY